MKKNIAVLSIAALLIALVAFSTSVAVDNNTTTNVSVTPGTNVSETPGTNVSETPGTNVSVTPVTTLPGGDMRIAGRVMDRLPDESLVPLEGVKVTATSAGDITAVLGSTTTKPDGYFTIDVPSKIIVDLRFTKAGYENRSEEGIDLTEYGKGDTYNMETIFMTRQPGKLCVNITAKPMNCTVCVNEDATYILTVCNCANIKDTIKLSMTGLKGNLSKDTFNLDAGDCDKTIKLTVRSSKNGTFDTTVRATSQGDTSVYGEVTVTTKVMGANLKVYVHDYVTGDHVGTTYKKNTTEGTECLVPEVWVEVRDLTYR